MSLKEILCQEKPIRLLQSAFNSGKVPGSYIFTGPDGVGKQKTATQFAKLLLCQNPQTTDNFADPCGKCDSCLQFDAGSHPDFNLLYKELLEFTKEGKGKNTPSEMPIDVIREFLVQKVDNRPTLSNRKVYVITEAEKLNKFSQNALLKTLEEPPAYCTIILICTRLEKLLPTTKSRCQILTFAPLSEDIILPRLKEMGLTPDSALFFTRFAQGSIGQACQFANLEKQGADIFRSKKTVLEIIAGCTYPQSLDAAAKILDENKKIAKAWNEIEENTNKSDITRKTHILLIRIIIAALHDALKRHLDPANTLLNHDQPQQIRQIADRLHPEQIADKIVTAYDAIKWVEASVNEKLIFDRLLLNLASSDTITV